MKKTTKSVSLDEQSFEEIVNCGGIYVDKTKAMYEVFGRGKYFFIARPRRFGKSLLCSTLNALFSGKKKLFEGTWIHESDWEWRAHPVIHLDMAKISHASATGESFSVNLLRVIKNIAHDNGIDDIDSDDPGGCFDELLRLLYKRDAVPVAVIIDEYDKPLLDVIGNADAYHKIQAVLSAFYVQLKSNSPYLRFVFLTGIGKFSKTSIFSGLNNLNDVSMDPRTAELCGFTDAEIRTQYAGHLAALAERYGMSVDAMMDELRRLYNGYSFGLDDLTGPVGSVYNPFCINHVLASRQLSKKWFASANPSFLIKLIEKHDFKNVSPEALRVSLYELEAIFDYDQLSIGALLFFSGYLTMRSYDREHEQLLLDYPNAEVAQAFSRALVPAFMHQPLSAFQPIMHAVGDCFREESFEQLKDLLNQLLSFIPYEMVTTTEAYFQTVFFLLFNAFALRTVGEEMTNRGRSDLVVLLPHAVFIIELKLDLRAYDALQQIRDRGYDERYRGGSRRVYRIGVSLERAKRVVTDLVWERV